MLCHQSTGLPNQGLACSCVDGKDQRQHVEKPSLISWRIECNEAEKTLAHFERGDRCKRWVREL